MTLPISVHSSRANVFQKETFWRLEQDELVREGGEPEKVSPLFNLLRVFLRILWPWWSLIVPVERGGPARFPLADIVEIRLRFDPTRFDTWRYRCDLRTRNEQKATIWSTHFRSVANFEDRGASYARLARALAPRVARANPQCRFAGGSRPLAYWAGLGLISVTMLLLIAVLTLLGGRLDPFILLRLSLFALWGWLAIPYARKNWPRRFDPANIPEALLPKEKRRDDRTDK